MAPERDDELDGPKNRNASGLGGGVSDMMKKALFATIGAVFMTEESVRAYVAESKLPREIRNYVIQNTAQAKEQFFSYLSKELSQLVMKSDLPKVVQGFLKDHTIEVEAKIRFRGNGAPELSMGVVAPPATAIPAPPAPQQLPSPAAATPSTDSPQTDLPAA